MQLYQAGLYLLPNTSYQLRLAAKSTDGRDVRLYLHKHRSPYTNYGLNGLTAGSDRGVAGLRRAVHDDRLHVARSGTAVCASGSPKATPPARTTSSTTSS